MNSISRLTLVCVCVCVSCLRRSECRDFATSYRCSGADVRYLPRPRCGNIQAQTRLRGATR